MRAGLRRDERGATAVFMALGMTVLLGSAAIAVDLGMLMTARAEAQNAADAAALAGAASLIYAPGDAAQARAWARAYAGENLVRGTPVALRDADIDVVGDTVRVRVLRTSEHGGQIPTLFARVLSTPAVDVAAMAAAVASDEAARVNCLLPLTLADGWVNEGSPEWDPSEGDRYEPPTRFDGSENPYHVGYDRVGQRITLKPSQGGKGAGPPESSRFEPGYYDLWLPGGVQGVPEIRSRILGCPDGPEATFGPGDPMWRVPGNKQTLAETARDILDDPLYSGQYFDPSCGCARDANLGDEVVTSGLRLRVVPVFAPDEFQAQGLGPHFRVEYFTGVFIESVDPGPPGKANVYARVVPFVGLPGSSSAGPHIRALRLVQ